MLASQASLESVSMGANKPKVSWFQRWLRRFVKDIDISKAFRWYYRKGYRKGLNKGRAEHPPILHGAFCTLHIPPIAPVLVEWGIFRCMECLRLEQERVTDKHAWIQHERQRIVDKLGKPDTQQIEAIRMKNMFYHMEQQEGEGRP